MKGGENQVQGSQRFRHSARPPNARCPTPAPSLGPPPPLPFPRPATPASSGCEVVSPRNRLITRHRTPRHGGMAGGVAWRGSALGWG